ncbi:alpha/beta hydrolase [Pseudomonas sp. gcc21]|uniref:alpha/beta fold hydrolase n=1 Tax=Pseudomonas sp. gcc21 TaxID=2726989 RepID=UPI0014523FA3|nr:alpha/beta hydrolase [Pseudomonas sp. gcc21]QJD58945.1 alpha/beta hydrolase [Pseudomonas sp. gcc21]
MRTRKPVTDHATEHGGKGGVSSFALVAAALGASAAAARYCTSRAEKEYPPAGQFVEVDGVRLHYVERGSGEPLVLLHGAASMTDDFLISPFLEMAAERYRVIVFDRPGYGYSERPRSTVWGPVTQAALFQEAFRKLDIDQPLVLGHSWGAMVALALGLDFPWSIKGVVLMSGYFYPTSRPELALTSVTGLPLFGDILRYTLSPWLVRAAWHLGLRNIFAPGPVPEHFKNQFPVWLSLRPLALRTANEEFALLNPASDSLHNRYSELEKPCVIISGDGDRVLSPLDHSARLHAEVRGSDYWVFPGVGHMPHHVEPQQVLAAINLAREKAADRK